MKNIGSSHRFHQKLPESLIEAIKEDRFSDDFCNAIMTLKYDPIIGLEKLEKCVNKGSIVGAYVLGDILFFGYREISDPKKGLEILKYAADRFSIEAIYTLSQIYYSWNDLDATKHELLQLASIKFPPALFNLGGIHRKEGDLIQARIYFELAEVCGHAMSINNLSILMAYGSYGFFARFLGLLKWIKNIPRTFKLMNEYPLSDLLRGGNMEKFGHSFSINARMSLVLIENS